MVARSNKMIGEFLDKPKTRTYFSVIEDYVKKLGPSKKEIKAQVSYSVHRKFLWMWAYEQTLDGTLYLTVTIDKKLDNPHFHYVTQTSKNRWNHHVEVKSKAIATSGWLHRLIKAGYDFAQK